MGLADELGEEQPALAVVRGLGPTLERWLAAVGSDVFLWAGAAAAATSLGLLASGRRQASGTVASWAPVLLGLGVYRKMVDMTRSAAYRSDLH
jgi:hypothetical protein